MEVRQLQLDESQTARPSASNRHYLFGAALFSSMFPSSKSSATFSRALFSNGALIRSLLFSDSIFSGFSFRLLVLYCLVAALSIAASQIIVVSLIVYWLAYKVYRSTSVKMFDRPASPILGRVILPMTLWFLMSAISTIVGVDVLHSIPELWKTGLYLLFPFAVYSSFSARKLKLAEVNQRIVIILLALITGQLIAGVHTFVEQAIGNQIYPKIPGPVTESGQLALLIPFIIAVLFSLSKQASFFAAQSITLWNKNIPFSIFLSGLGLLLLFTVWPQLIIPSSSSGIIRAAHIVGLLFSFAVLLSFAIDTFSNGLKPTVRQLCDVTSPSHVQFFVSACILLLLVLLINLKRGPWLGVWLALIILGALVSKRTLLITLLLSAALVLFPSPARDRVTALADDFAIGGGRQVMWTMGTELAQRFPLGVGPDNASIMRKIDPNLPELHRHMHNNLLNVTVETGWIGVTLFVFWMFVVIKLGFTAWKQAGQQPNLRQSGLMALGLSCGLIAWQIAGLVEYNFGDGEVRLIAFLFMGLLLALATAIYVEQPAIEANVNQ